MVLLRFPRSLCTLRSVNEKGEASFRTKVSLVVSRPTPVSTAIALQVCHGRPGCFDSMHLLAAQKLGRSDPFPSL